MTAPIEAKLLTEIDDNKRVSNVTITYFTLKHLYACEQVTALQFGNEQISAEKFCRQIESLSQNTNIPHSYIIGIHTTNNRVITVAAIIYAGKAYVPESPYSSLPELGELLQYNQPISVVHPVTEKSFWEQQASLARLAGGNGTSAQKLIEQYIKEKTGGMQPQEDWQLIKWSAATTDDADAFAVRLTQWLEQNPAISLKQLAETLQVTDDNSEIKKFVVAKDREELVAALKAVKKVTPKNNSQLVFLFPGQGSQYTAMGTALYTRFPAFRDAFEQCRAILLSLTGEDILAILFETDENEILHHTRYAQACIFSVGYALSQLWMSLGIAPHIILGHSVGEFVAAHIAGVFSLEDGLKLVAERARLVCDTEEGAMLVVRSTKEKITPLLTEGVTIGAINSANNLVVAGSVSDIQLFKTVLHNNTIPYIALNTSHAFHHPSMDAIVPAFKDVVETIQLHPPALPIISSITGSYLKAEEATNPDYWARHMSAVVEFEAASAFLTTQHEDCIILEAGPGKTLFSFIKNADRRRTGTPSIHADLPEMKQFLQAVGLLWQNGYAIDWQALYPCNLQKVNGFAELGSISDNAAGDRHKQQEDLQDLLIAADPEMTVFLFDDLAADIGIPSIILQTELSIDEEAKTHGKIIGDELLIATTTHKKTMMEALYRCYHLFNNKSLITRTYVHTDFSASLPRVKTAMDMVGTPALKIPETPENSSK